MTASALVAVAGVFGIGYLIGLLVLLNAEDSVTAVARAAARDISGSFWVGVLWQLLAIPLLVALVLACAITVVGILAIPFAILGWALAYFGAFTLGLVAIAMVAGRAIAGRGTGGGTRAVALRSLGVGLAALSVVWFAAALLADIRVLGGISRLAAVALSWAAATIGLGAVVRSRGGVLKMRFETTSESSVPSWQTPTPVAGVVAARRPVATVHADEEQ